MQPPFSALWKQAPLIRFAIPLFAGIVLQEAIGFSENQLIAGTLLLFLFYAGICFIPSVIHFEKPYLKGIPLMMLCLISGAWLYYVNDLSHHTDWIGHYNKNQPVIIVTLKEPAIERAKTYKAEAVVEAIFHKGEWQKVSGNILMYFSKDTDERMLCYGAKWAVSSLLRPIKNAGNPGEFDYAGYAAKKNIYHTSFETSATGFYLGQSRDFGFMRLIHASRTSIVSVFKKYLSDYPGTSGLAEALVIGYKNDLDRQVVSDYTNTGVVHVIAISGMHLALVYFVLEWLWRLLAIHRRKILSGILSILILWVFSFLTGGSPSVLRSAIMFTFVISGRMINREGSVFNSLTASALFLAAYDPFVLWDAGFLLSHFAVLGLITLQPVLSDLIQIKNKWIARAVDMLLLTTAAQVFTLPLCLYYFHQFPVYFLLSNLIIIPLSTIILFGGILLIMVSSFPELAGLVGFLLGYLIKWMNGIAALIGRWPGALIKDIYFGKVGLVLLFIFIIFLSLWLIRNEIKFLKASFALLFLFFLVGAFIEIHHARQRLFIVYNVRGHSACDIILGNRYFFWGDSALVSDRHLQDSILSGSRNYLRADHQMAGFDMERYSFLDAGRFKIACMNDRRATLADFVVVNGQRGCISDFTWVQQKQQVIFDGSCKLWKIEKWMSRADSLHLHGYPVPLKGAFSVTIPAGNTSL